MPINLHNLKKRLIFPLWAVPLGLWLINSELKFGVGHYRLYPGQIITILLCVAASGEYNSLVKQQFGKNAFWMIQIWLLIQLTFDAIGVNVPWLVSCFFLFAITIFEAFFCNINVESRWKRASLIFCGSLILYMAGFSLIHLYDISFHNMFYYLHYRYFFHIGITIIVAAVFICDTSAYFIGSIWGRHHLSRVSPQKTFEGGIAGFLSSILVCLIGWHLSGNHSAYSQFTGIILGVACGIGAIGGDLIVSIIKRHFGVKDSSTLLGGHGGILDRFGSLFISAIAVRMALWAFESLMIIGKLYI